MQVIENLKLNEKVFFEKLENGMPILIIPKKNMKKKYMIWGVNYGANDSKFIIPNENKEIEVPNGVAHFLEHKMFEQENGRNSLDVLTSLGVEANAYTTNDHTAYLFECTDNFYPAMEELMDYVQNPYFTDENVEKEKGIIGQEIKMYEDYPDWNVYLNALQAMYHKNPVKINIVGTIESISKIDKEVLYKCYNTFYRPDNMVMVICGDFEPEKLLSEIKARIKPNNQSEKVERIYPEEPDSIVKEKVEQKLDVSQPIYAIGIKDIPTNCLKGNNEEIIKKYLAVNMILELIIGKSSSLYKRLYNKGTIYNGITYDYEMYKTFSHIIISGQSKEPEEIYEELKKEIIKLKEEGINESDFNRIKKKFYGEYIVQFNDVGEIARMFLTDYIKGLNSFDYLEQIKNINVEYLVDVLKDVFKEEKMVISIVRN